MKEYDDKTPTQKSVVGKWTGIVIRIFVPFVLLVFVGRYIYRDWHKISGIISDVQPGWTVVAFLFYFAGVACVAFNWKTLLTVLGTECSYETAFKSYYYSMLAKYIPGRIWGATGRVVLTRQAAIPEGTTILGILLESLLLMISASFVGFLTIGSFSQFPVEIRCLAIGSPAILLLLHPFVLHNALRIMSKKFPKFVVQPENLPGFKQMVFLVLRYCLIWILQGLGFWCALKSLATIPFSSLWPVLGGNALAWLAGFVVVFTPAGLGVREIVLTRINVGTVGAGPAALVAIMARFFMIFSELIGAFLIFLFQLKKRDIKDNPSRVA